MTQNMLYYDKQKFRAQELYPEKSLSLAYVLLFLLGIFGAHRFYLGKYGTAVTQLVLTILGFLTAFFTFGLLIWIVFIWVLIDIYHVYQIIKQQNHNAKQSQFDYLESVFSSND